MHGKEYHVGTLQYNSTVFAHMCAGLNSLSHTFHCSNMVNLRMRVIRQTKQYRCVYRVIDYWPDWLLINHVTKLIDEPFRGM